MICGMSPEEFWHGNFQLASAYREAYRLKASNARWERYLEGVYVLEALKAAAPTYRELTKWKGRKPEFPQEPIDLDEEELELINAERERRKAEKFKQQMLAMMMARKEVSDNVGSGGRQDTDTD